MTWVGKETQNIIKVRSGIEMIVAERQVILLADVGQGHRRKVVGQGQMTDVGQGRMTDNGGQGQMTDGTGQGQMKDDIGQGQMIDDIDQDQETEVRGREMEKKVKADIGMTRDDNRVLIVTKNLNL